ncbi:raffinose/stachyose/melibiose transport system permease protein [Clostridium saccharoperbutylacetonicum]|uniref:ABC-type sugar transport system, permease component n=1 Tax=Clostridium saccharoperbutylacetonicum N1-4(HMT) TaxID=931276 RepID=M1ML18_9CLOT|nr:MULTISPECIES: carbohydrate ABC transporter permease [Clostridium]AGF58619.1 ABC-type sugar transport system, permease component [Clostridium saccharoperbutylacetonicum N1-4(HMT)]NRT60602.1 raffinose/stachyose/melibiose transport system permease protein [Clostridium saccharoperbutylacetonicum]NSB23916.1 raffinose/stachyose/melibiose transport system permease protein [Clostridium saccharoperbutylacetonicum]NSB43292.1 raffinose/stachyose/melibiose transport system permease protein [Clostridium 
MSSDYISKMFGGKIVNKLLYIVLIIWAVIQIFPLYWLITFSLKNNSEIFGGNLIGLPEKFLWENYGKALVNANVGVYFMNSVIITAVTIFLTVIVSLMASYALVRMKWKFRNTTMLLFMAGLMIPIHAALLPIFLILRKVKLLDTYWALIIPYVAFAIPMAILILTSFMKSIPREIEEAACIDGCSIYRIFFSIIVPILRPAVATISIFTFLQAWNELMFATVFISKAAYKPLTVGIQSMAGKYSTEWGPIGAALVIATIPTVIIYLLMSSQVHKSLTAGALKG